MFISKKAYDELNTRIVELAREVGNLNRENNYIHDESRDLRYENEDLRDNLREIAKIATSNIYNDERAVLTKIRELVRDI